MKNVKSLWRSILYCLKLSWKTSKFHTITRLAGNLITPLNSIISAFLLKYILDTLTGTAAAPIKMQHLLLLLLASLLLTVINAAAQKIAAYSSTVHNEMIQNEISLSMLEKAVQADMELFDNPKYYDRFTAIRNDSASLSGILWSSLECFSAFFSFIGAFLVLCQSHFLYAFLIALVSIPSAVFSQRYTKLLYQNDLEQINNFRQKYYIFGIGSEKEYAQDVRYLHLGGMLKRKYEMLWEKIFIPKKILLKKRSITTCLLCLLPEVFIAAITLHIGYQVINSLMSIGDYSLYTGLLVQISGSILLFTNHIIMVYDNKLKIENMRAFDDFSYKRIVTGSLNIDKVSTIEFQDVSFQYPGMEKKVLNQLSFVIHDREKVAFVGTNGAGKSTIIKLLLRLYDVTEGNILINGINIKQYDIEKLHQCFGVYFQNGLNYGFTLRENISPEKEASEKADDKRKEILLACEGKDVFLNCNQDMGTYLGRIFSEEGVELSIGQHQKTALARSLYHNASALILDEPSSSLDPEAESHIFDYLDKACSKKTTIFTSHRLSNVHLADRIIVIENGKIIEQGTQEELLRNPKRYAQLYEYQARKFKS